MKSVSTLVSNAINGMQQQIEIQATSGLHYPFLQTNLANCSTFPVTGGDEMISSASTRGVENALEQCSSVQEEPSRAPVHRKH